MAPKLLLITSDLMHADTESEKPDFVLIVLKEGRRIPFQS